MMGPRLTADDVRLWGSWQATALLRSRSSEHRRRVDQAKRVIARGLSVAPRTAVMWSGGKDSTVMTHLACVAMGAAIDVFSEKDDLDYPGEREYVTGLATAWGLRLNVLTPPISPAGWMAEHASELGACADLHSRAAGLSKACFYDVVESATAGYAGVMLGLRQEESRGRRMNRCTNGLLYERSATKTHPSQWTSTPLADWSGLDVMAYLASHAIDPLPVYRCIAFDPIHARQPWRVRKSWWVPGVHSHRGATGWLRHYWPELYRQLVMWIPAAQGVS